MFFGHGVFSNFVVSLIVIVSFLILAFVFHHVWNFRSDFETAILSLNNAFLTCAVSIMTVGIWFIAGMLVTARKRQEERRLYIAFAYTMIVISTNALVVIGMIASVNVTLLLLFALICTSVQIFSSPAYLIMQWLIGQQTKQPA